MEETEFGGMRTAHSPIVVFGIILFGVLSSCSYSSSKMLTDDEVAVLFLRQKYYSRFLFVVGAGDTTLRSFSIDNTTGSLTPAGIVSPSVAGIGIDIHPTLPYVYQTLNGSDGIEAFRFDQTSAALTSVGVVTTGNNNSHRVRVLADGNSLFFNSVQCGNTCVWRLPLSAGLPGTQAQVNNTIPNNSQWMDVDPRGRFLYSANNGGGFGINMFQINGSSALISQGSITINGGEQPSEGVFNSDGTALYALVQNTRVVAYSINQTTGVLSLLSSDPLPGLPILMHPKGTFLYAFNTGSGIVRTYRINADKSFTVVTDQTAGGVSFDHVCMERGGRFLFLTKFAAPGVILTYSIADNGALTPVATLTVSGSSQFMQCTTSIESRIGWF